MSTSPASKQVQKLKAENKRLKEQLARCQSWIRREIAEKAYTINKRRTQDETRSQMSLESYEQITSMIESYFGQLIYVEGFHQIIPHLVDAETNFFHFMHKKEFDGFVVTNGYQKALEILIEHLITKGYRNYARRTKTMIRGNNLMEKTLHKTVTKGYLLSVGKFFEAIKKVQTQELHGKYEIGFKEYLKKSGPLGEYLLSPTFLDAWSPILKTEVFGSRRHSGTVSKEEVCELRTKITGNYESNGGILYQLIDSAHDVGGNL